MKRVVIAIYIDPDFYPPTINAILNIAETAEEVIVISRNNNLDDYPYPSNVYLHKAGKFATVRDMEIQSTFKKLLSFLQFTWLVLKFGISRKTSLVVLYDSFALFSFFISRWLLGKKKVWYHNHDMPAKKSIKKYSIGALASKYEYRAMKHIDFFSLPAVERLGFYSYVPERVKTFIIPNYPSLKVYALKPPLQNDNESIRIIYQGFIGAGHSIEELIPILSETINGRRLQLILKGSVTPDYKNKLTTLAKDFAVEDKLVWVPIGPYKELPSLTASCDIGIGINMNTDNVSLTQGTASNKIYEYAACGLSVILYDSRQFRNYLEEYRWAAFTDGSVDSLRKTITSVVLAMPLAGNVARADFETKLNFELAFLPALDVIKSALPVS